MTKQLRLEEMIDCANMTDNNQLIAAAAIFAGELEALGHTFARLLANHFDVECGKTACEEEGFSGCCTPFYAKEIGQRCPEPLDLFDATEWSTSDGTDLDHDTGKEV